MISARSVREVVAFAAGLLGRDGRLAPFLPGRDLLGHFRADGPAPAAAAAAAQRRGGERRCRLRRLGCLSMVSPSNAETSASFRGRQSFAFALRLFGRDGQTCSISFQRQPVLAISSAEVRPAASATGAARRVGAGCHRGRWRRNSGGRAVLRSLRRRASQGMGSPVCSAAMSSSVSSVNPFLRRYACSSR